MNHCYSQSLVTFSSQLGKFQHVTDGKDQQPILLCITIAHPPHLSQSKHVSRLKRYESTALSSQPITLNTTNVANETESSGKEI